MADGTVLLLDENGRVHADTTWVARPAGSGIGRLLDDSPTGAERLMAAMREHVGTAIAATTGHGIGVVALGDATGTVRAFGDVTDSAALHDGPVNALAAVGVALDGETSVPLIYSGGADGTLRAWAPGNTPMATPLAQRPCPVMSLDAAATENGPAIAVAWGDGAVEWIHWDTGAQRMFRPGPPVRAVALTADNRVLIGMDESMICLTPRRGPVPDGDTPQV
ncbi:hypothetical protein [Streptomyces sp. NPDC088246]|uniref:hypothetical protein n=1 Tax=Streptomyces sp. NPDC088246 TaxID=3365842 RepID=UPI00381103AA